MWRGDQAGDTRMSAHLEIRGLEKVLARLDSAKLDGMMRDAMRGVVDELQAEMMVYPPPPPNSTYRRTDKLKQSWAKRVTGSGRSWLGVVGNRIKYAPYVQDENRQAAVHKRTGWQTVQSVAKDKKDWCVNFIHRAITRWARS